MLILYKRYLLFLIGCIGVRTLFTLFAKYCNPTYLPYLGYIALLPVLGWAYIYFFSPRDSGPEVFGDKIWWNDLRPAHAMLWSLFAIYAIQMKTFAYVPLAIDTAMGLFAFLTFHKLIL